MQTPETKAVATPEAKPEVEKLTVVAVNKDNTLACRNEEGEEVTVAKAPAEEVKPEAPKAEAPKPTFIEKCMNIVTANTRIGELQADNANLLAKVTDLEAQVEQAQNFVHEASTAKEKLTNDIASLKADHAKALENTKAEYQAKIDALNKQLEDKKVALNNEVVTELASVGIQQGEIKQEILPTLTPQQAYTNFMALEVGPARSAYFKAHEALIVEGSRTR